MPSEPDKSRTKFGILTSLILPHKGIKNNADRTRAQISALLSLVMLVLEIIGVVASIAANGVSSSNLGLAGLFLTTAISYILTRSRQYKIGAFLLVATLSIAGLLFFLSGLATNLNTLYITTISSMILAGVLLSVSGMLILILLNIISVGILIYSLPSIPDDFLAISLFTTVGMLIVVTTLFRNRIEANRIQEIASANSELDALRKTLEHQVKERTGQIRTAAEIAQTITSSLPIGEILDRTVKLIVERFGFYHAGIYLLDPEGRYVVLSASAGEADKQLMIESPRIKVDEKSIIGWVAHNRHLHASRDVSQDIQYLVTDLLPLTKSEVGVPLLFGDQLLGVLDVQSQHLDAFDEDDLITLQILAQQASSALQTVRLIESTQVNLQSVSEVYRYGYLIAEASSETDVYTAMRRAVEATPYEAVLMIVEGTSLHVVAGSVPYPTPNHLEINPEQLDQELSAGIIYNGIEDLFTLPRDLFGFYKNIHFDNIAMLPVRRAGKLIAVFTVGSTKSLPILPTAIQPYASVAELTVSALERIQNETSLEEHIKELESIAQTSQAVSAADDLESLFTLLHSHVQNNIGDYSFLVALYDADTNSIRIPYMVENTSSGERINVDSFPLGEGLTSILVRTKQPLMITEDTEKRAAALGAKISGRPAKSWLGTPLIVANDVIGAVIVQDTEKENAFAERDLRFMTTLSTQVAGAINNIRLVDETRKRALQLQTAAEIARDISGSLDIGDLLTKAVSLIRDRFSFYHAAVFLIDPAGEHAVIREATGDAGMQMKRVGHKLRIGSKSIVGFVTSSGEHLVVNDTTRDATYYPNPLLPETKAEVAIPLKVGQRILGALDVQSTKAYTFGTEDINVLRILADQMAIAVINSELFAETQEHLSQHRLLHHVTTAAASGTTLGEALSSAAQGLQVTLGGDRVAILLADRLRKVLRVEAIAGYSEDVRKIEVPYGEGVTGWVALNLQPVRLNDVTQDPRYIKVGSNVCSELAIPLSYRGELLGVLNVESDQIGAYTENDEELLGTLGGSLAAIIANARLLGQIRNQIDRERLLYEVTSKIRRSTDMQSIMSTTADELSKVLGARKAKIKIDLSNDNPK